MYVYIYITFCSRIEELKIQITWRDRKLLKGGAGNPPIGGSGLYVFLGVVSYI